MAKVPEAVSRPFAALASKKGERKAEASKPDASSAPRPRTQPNASAEPARSSADDHAFALHMRGVKRLAGKAQRVPSTDQDAAPAARDSAERRERVAASVDLDAEARNDLAGLVSAGLRFEVVDDGTLLEGRRLDVDPRELRRLRKQRYAIDGKIDLHGQSAAGAKEVVERFVERRRSQGDRALLIIHGKGLHSPRQASVLRGELGAWLSQGRAAKDVLAFASVEEQDGGSGALMVLLAKR